MPKIKPSALQTCPHLLADTALPSYDASQLLLDRPFHSKTILQTDSMTNCFRALSPVRLAPERGRGGTVMTDWGD